MKRFPRRLYAVLLLFVAVSTAYLIINLASLVDGIWLGHGRIPFEIDFDALQLTDLKPEAAQAGLMEGDRLESLNGEGYRGESHWVRAARHKDIGTILRVGVRRTDGSLREASIPLQPEDDSGAIPRGTVFFFLLLGGPVPLICLLIGYWVAAARPQDPNAWLVLGLLTVPETLVRFDSGGWPGLMLLLPRIWYWIIQILAPSILLWFGLRFPQRSRLDRRVPWLKWLLLAPQLLWFGMMVWSTYVRVFAPASREWTAWALSWSSTLVGPAQITCVALYAIVLVDNYRSATSADARRRMRVLCMGGLIAVIAILVLVLVLPLFGLDENFAVVLPVVALVFVLPLSVAYVVVVQRAMDVRLLVRMGTKYALARGTVLAFRIVLSATMTVLLIRAIRSSEFGLPVMFRLALLGALLFVASSRTRKLSEFIDRKFFREAYNVDLVLSELSEQVRTFKEKTPLLETVTKRVSDVLHASPIAVLLGRSEVFHLHCAIGLDLSAAVALPEKSATVRHLLDTNQPATIYREHPESWFLKAEAAERQVLDAIQAELLLPIPGRGRLMGVMALGPKKSEEPYTPSDVRMLQSVATQTGLALEVTELAESLAQEATQRERMQREIEIAREVQERLFPQEMPSIPGITIAGACRPAHAVGGDYYDVISLGDELLGLAIGDVSGKGISAALLMASLRASLRGMTLYGSGDLAQMMQKVNRLVYEASASNRYATFFFAVYDTAAKDLRFVNAGHNPPIIVRRHSNQTLEILKLEAGGPVIGLLPHISYTEASIKLERGDLVLMYTDGISEAMNPDDEEWGERRMTDAAKTAHDKPAPEVLSSVFRDADAFINGAVQHDDMTVLVMVLESLE
jgi:sigma-B regulation protein RsbU (phosphoserine phosphatase)